MGPSIPEIVSVSSEKISPPENRLWGQIEDFRKKNKKCSHGFNRNFFLVGNLIRF